MYVPDIIKSIDVKVFILMSRINETRQIIWHENCKCVCRLTKAVCDRQQTWNEDKCKCKCNELAGRELCYKGFFGILVIVSVNVINHGA